MLSLWYKSGHAGKKIMPNHRSHSWIAFLSFAACLCLSSCGMELGWPEQKSATEDQDSKTTPKLRIFVTKATTNGKIGSGSIGQADSLCEQDENKPETGTYRALLSDGTNRVALPLAQRKDWVLEAKRTYIRPDNTVIGTTTSQAVLPFPLKAAISTEKLEVWTGIGGGAWTAGLSCGTWSKDDAAVSGVFGYSDRIVGEALAGGTSSCETARRLYCVEQAPLDDDEE